MIVKLGVVMFGSMLVALVAAASDTNIYIPLWIALIVAIPSAFTPLAMAYIQQRARRKEKEQDWERQDAVAKKVEEVRKASENRTVQLDKLTKGQEVIHSLVDGQMTAALQSELDSKTIALALMREVIDLRKHEHGEPSKESLATIRTMEDSINDLKKKIEARHNIEAKMTK